MNQISLKLYTSGNISNKAEEVWIKSKFVEFMSIIFNLGLLRFTFFHSGLFNLSLLKKNE